MGGIVDFLLKMVGLPSDLITEIDAAAPSFEKLAALEQQLVPIFATPQTLAQHISAAAPILQQAVPDILAVLPVVKSLSLLATPKQ